MKKTWAIRKDAEGVSPVIATILMVAITVVLAAVLYVMVLGFGTDTTTTPTSSITKTTVSSGVKLTFAPVSVDTQWDDITILLSDGTNTIQWTPATANLDNTTTAKELLGTGTGLLGSLAVYCNVTDLAGNGYVNQGDYFTLISGGGSFSTATTYTATIIHAPSAGEMCHQTFQG
ncbi:MAG: type IV pilin [Candidatus Thermoplasmatota archaeon]|nr:type IV pilin [Candidatus Thermoplasmatota archaeon]